MLRAVVGVGEEAVSEGVLGSELREGGGDWVGMRKAVLKRAAFFVGWWL